MTWYLVVLIHMGTLRPPVENYYAMPSEMACRESLNSGRVISKYEDLVVMFCTTDGENK